MSHDAIQVLVGTYLVIKQLLLRLRGFQLRCFAKVSVIVHAVGQCEGQQGYHQGGTDLANVLCPPIAGQQVELVHGQQGASGEHEDPCQVEVLGSVIAVQPTQDTGSEPGNDGAEHQQDGGDDHEPVGQEEATGGSQYRQAGKHQ